MKNVYPMIDNGFVSLYDYPKIILMQSQESIGFIKNNKITFYEQKISKKEIMKRNLKRTTNK